MDNQDLNAKPINVEEYTLRIGTSRYDRETGALSEPEIVALVKEAKFAVHISAALYHMARVREGSVCLMETAPLVAIAQIMTDHAEHFAAIKDRKVQSLIMALITLYSASDNLRPEALFHPQHPEILRAVNSTFPKEGESHTDLLKRQATDLVTDGIVPDAKAKH